MRTSIRRTSRRGVALALALLLIAVTVIASVTMVSQLRRRRAEIGSRHERLEADLLAEAGFTRARIRLEADAAWAGETWLARLEGSAPEPKGGDAAGVESGAPIGRVVIQVAPRAADGSRLVTVTATWPADRPLAVTETRSRTLRIPRTAAASDAGTNSAKRGAS
jgi:hypothetical protein